MVTALGAVALLVAVVLTLSAGTRQWVATNGVSLSQWVAVLEPGERFCQDGGYVPANAGELRMRIGTHRDEGPPVQVRFLAGDREVTGGALERGWQEVDAEIPLRPLREPIEADRMCLTNEGPARLALGGNGGLVRTEFWSAEERSWWGWFGDVRERFAAGRSSWFGEWSLVVALVLVLASAGLAIFVAARRIR